MCVCAAAMTIRLTQANIDISGYIKSPWKLALFFNITEKSIDFPQVPRKVSKRAPPPLKSIHNDFETSHMCIYTIEHKEAKIYIGSRAINRKNETQPSVSGYKQNSSSSRERVQYRVQFPRNVIIVHTYNRAERERSWPENAIGRVVAAAVGLCYIYISIIYTYTVREKESDTFAKWFPKVVYRRAHLSMIGECKASRIYITLGYIYIHIILYADERIAHFKLDVML